MPRGYKTSPGGWIRGPGTIMEMAGDDEATAAALQKLMLAILEWERVGAGSGDLPGLVEALASGLALAVEGRRKESEPETETEATP